VYANSPAAAAWFQLSVLLFTTLTR
jgi:hypothetical protein